LQHLIALLDRKTGKRQKERPRFIKQDNVAIARLQTTGVVCIEKFTDFPQMGRFTLRDEGTVRMPFTLIERKKSSRASCFTADVALGAAGSTLTRLKGTMWLPVI